MSVLPYFRIPRPGRVKSSGPVEHAVSQWRAVGRSLGMSPSELDQFADAFKHGERGAASAASR